MWAQHLGIPSLCPGTFPGNREHPDLLMVFAPSDALQTSGIAQEITEISPETLVIGCSTGTSITGETLFDDGFAAVAVGFDHTTLRMAHAELHEPAASLDAGERIGQELTGDGLRYVLVLSDGLDVNGSALVRGLASTLGPDVVVSGGLAADGPRFAATCVLADGRAVANTVAAIGFYGDHLQVGIGSGGGWNEFGPKREITRAEGNTLFEFDGQPALDLYERYLGNEAAGLPASGLLYPLMIYAPSEQLGLVRTILSVDREARSLTFAGDMPVGWQARLMRGQYRNLVKGAEHAAQDALTSLRRKMPTLNPALSLMVSCVGRRILLGQRTVGELNAVRDVLGNNGPLIGFYSNGEIGPHDAPLGCGLHNQTVTMTLLAELP